MADLIASRGRFAATYTVVPAGLPIEAVAEATAAEQSSGTFVAVPGETPELIEGHGAERIIEHPTRDGAYAMTLSWPQASIDANVSMLYTTLVGNAMSFPTVTAMRLECIHLAPEFAACFPGPAFGVRGTRRLAGVEQRPLIGTIVKPSIGLSAAQTAALVQPLAAAGLDFVKDDELNSNPAHAPLLERVRAIQPVIDEAAHRTGRKLMYAYNITGSVEQMLRRHDAVLAAGGTCVMVNVNAVGLAGLQAVREHSALPIHGHPAGWGAFMRATDFGVSFGAYQMLTRLAGTDHMHVGSLASKFQLEEGLTAPVAARMCLERVAANADDRLLPAFSGGQTVRHLAPTLEQVGSDDFLYLAGGSMHTHPTSAAAGCIALFQACEAARTGIALEDAARMHSELRLALQGASS